jgi:hypothetical protein
MFYSVSNKLVVIKFLGKRMIFSVEIEIVDALLAHWKCLRVRLIKKYKNLIIDANNLNEVTNKGESILALFLVNK